MSDPEFRIEYTIQRCDEDGGDFYDVGFGSSGGWNGINAALYAVESAVQNREWETEPGMPEPRDAETHVSAVAADPLPCAVCGGRDHQTLLHGIPEPDDSGVDRG